MPVYNESKVSAQFWMNKCPFKTTTSKTGILLGSTNRRPVYPLSPAGGAPGEAGSTLLGQSGAAQTAATQSVLALGVYRFSHSPKHFSPAHH